MKNDLEREICFDYEDSRDCLTIQDVNMHIADQKLMKEMMCGSNVLSETEYREIVVAIAEYASNVVIKTLGPYGKTTNVDDSTFVSPTKDGWTLLRNLRFSDPLYNIIFNVIIQISFDLVTKVGDGTTSALIGANYFMHAILDEMKRENSPLHNIRQADLLHHIEKIRDIIAVSVDSSEDIYHINMDGDFRDVYDIAHVASNRNDKLAHIIQKIYQETKNPNIFVTLDAGDNLDYKIQDGFKYDGKVLDQNKYRNSEDGTYQLDEPLLVAIFDHNVTYNEHRNVITALSNYAHSRRQSVLVMAPYFDDILTNIMHTTISSMAQQNQIPDIILMQVPLATDFDRDTMSDFELLTNAQIFDYGKVRAINVTCHNQNPANIDNKIEDALLNIEQYKFESVEDCIRQCAGKINRAIIGEKYLVIQRYDTIYNKSLYEARIKEIKDRFTEIVRRTNKSSNTLTREYLNAQQRYIKMIGRMGTIYVGAQTELEKHCLKDSVDDAVLACRSAVRSGCVRGLNLTTLNEIRKLIEENDGLDDLDKIILRMFYFVFSEMALSVLRNKYPEEEMHQIVTFTDGESKLLCRPVDAVYTALINDYSLDLVTNEFQNRGSWTIVNSLATDIEILNSVVGVLSILLTSDQFISLNKQYDRKINREILLDKKREDAKAEELGRLEARKEFIDNIIEKNRSDEDAENKEGCCYEILELIMR